MNEIAISKSIEDGVQVAANINIDIREIVSIGVAKMERKFGLKIKELQAQQKQIAADIKKLDEENSQICTKTLPSSFETIVKGIKALPLKKGFDLFVHSSINSHSQKNEHHIDFQKKGNMRANPITMRLADELVDLTEEQKQINEKTDDLIGLSGTIQEQIVDLKRKMSDVPKLERQLKARIMETQLKRSSEGEDLLSSLMEQFELDLDFLG